MIIKIIRKKKKAEKKTKLRIFDCIGKVKTVSADLHCHTRMSDGSASIDEVVILAKRQGIKTIAVTDHDTFAGATRARVFGARQGVEVIHGAEISCVDPDRGRKVHLLCYLCASPGRLEGMLKKTRESRKQAAAEMMRKIMRLYPITPEMVARRAQGSTNIFKQHIMQALIDAGYASVIFGDLFRHLFHPKEGVAYVKVEYPSAKEVLQKIHEAGGLAVLAHPAVYDSYDLMEELVPLGLDGVEVWHPRNRAGDEDRLSAFCERHHLIMTGGTDFHGVYTSQPKPLGTCTAPDDQVAQLKDHCLKYQK